MDWGWVGITIRLGIFHLMTSQFQFPISAWQLEQPCFIMCDYMPPQHKNASRRLESNSGGRGQQGMLNWKLSRCGERRPDLQFQLSCCVTLNTSLGCSEPQKIKMPVRFMWDSQYTNKEVRQNYMVKTRCTMILLLHWGSNPGSAS